jgi:hypothetical protein
MALSASVSVARSSPRMGGHEVVASDDVAAAGLEVYARTGSHEAACREIAENIVYALRERIGTSRDGADAHFVTQATKTNGEWHALIAREGGFEVGPPLSRLYRDMDPRLVQHYMESYERAWNDQGLRIRVNSAEAFSSNRTYLEVPQKVVAHGFEMVQVTHIEIPLVQNGEAASAQVRSLVTRLFGPEAIDPSSPTGFKVPAQSEWSLNNLHQGIVEHLIERDASIASEYLRRSESFLKDPALHQKTLTTEIEQLTKKLSADPQILKSWEDPSTPLNLERLANAFQHKVITYLSEQGISVSPRPLHISPELAATFQNKEFERFLSSLPLHRSPVEVATHFTPPLDSMAMLRIGSDTRSPSFEPYPLFRSVSLSHWQQSALALPRLDNALMRQQANASGILPKIHDEPPRVTSPHAASQTRLPNGDHLLSSLAASPFIQLSYPSQPQVTAPLPLHEAVNQVIPLSSVRDTRSTPLTAVHPVSDQAPIRAEKSLHSFRSSLSHRATHSSKLPLRLNKARPGLPGQKVPLRQTSEAPSQIKSRVLGRLANAKSLGLRPLSSTRYSIRASIRLSFDGIRQARKTLTTLIRGAVSAAHTAPLRHPPVIGSIVTAIRSTPLHSVRLSITALLPRDLQRGVSQLIKQLSERGLQTLRAVRLAVRRPSPHLAISNRRVVARGEPTCTRRSRVSSHHTITNHRLLARALREAETIARHRSENRALPRAICSPQRAALNLLRQLERSLALKRSPLTDKTQVQSRAVSKSDLAVLIRLLDRNIARSLKRLSLFRQSLSPLQTRQLRAMLRISKARRATLDVAALLSLNETLDEFLHRPIRRTRDTGERPQKPMKRGRSGLERARTDAPNSADYAHADLESTPIPSLENRLSGSSLLRPLSGPRTLHSRKAGSQPSNFPRPAASSANAILPEEAPSNELTTQRIRLRNSQNTPDQRDDSSVDSTAPSPYSFSL